MYSKPWWASKTLWVNAVALAASALAALGVADVGAEARASIVGGAMALANILLRLMTKEAVGSGKGGGRVLPLALALSLALSGCAGVQAHAEEKITKVPLGSPLAYGVPPLPCQVTVTETDPAGIGMAHRIVIDIDPECLRGLMEEAPSPLPPPAGRGRGPPREPNRLPPAPSGGGGADRPGNPIAFHPPPPGEGARTAPGTQSPSTRPLRGRAG